MHHLSSIIIAISALTLAVAANVCTKSPYDALTCLSGATEAAAHCTKLLNAEGLASTTTTRTTVTSIIVHTAIETTASTIEATSTATDVTIVTQTVEQAAESTVYSAVYLTSSVKETVTVYTSSTPGPGSTATHTSQTTSTEPGSCPNGTALMELSALSSSKLFTACSCLSMLPLSTTTETKHLSSTATATGTASQVKAAVTSSVETGLVQLTAEAATTLDFYITTFVTSTKTVTVAAPSYTHVWGPQAGCADVSDVGMQQLAYAVVERDEAVGQCQGYCTNRTDCAALFVQRMFTDYGDVKPLWQCFFNNGTFDAATDVQCGRAVGIWGTAVAYDAVGRGGTSTSHAATSTAP